MFLKSSEKNKLPPILTRDFFLGYIGFFFFCLSFWLLVYFPAFMKELGASEQRIGILVGAMGVTSVILRPFIGKHMDEFGRKRVLLIIGIINVVACFAYAFIDSTGIFPFLVRLVYGIAWGGMFAAYVTLGADIVPASRRSEGIGIFGTGGMLPMAVGPSLAELILNTWDYRSVFLAAGIAAVIALILSQLVKESSTSLESENRSGFRATLFHKPLSPVWFMAIIFGVGLTTYTYFLSVYVESHLVTDFFLIYGLTTVCLRIFAGKIPDKVGLEKMFITTFLILALGQAVLSLGKTPLLMMLAGFLCGLGHGYVFPVISTLSVNRSNPDSRGITLSLMTALVDVGQYAGAPLCGLIWKWAGLPTMYRIVGIVFLLSAGVYFLMERKIPQADRHWGENPE